MRKKTVILLTACISPNGMAFTALQDPKERERQYIDAVRFYADSTDYPIVFCNNSGENIAPNFLDLKDRVEFLSFFGNDYDKNLGKGYGEYYILAYAFKNSQFIRQATNLIKITGRLKVKNIQNQIRLSSFVFAFSSPYILVSNLNDKDRFAHSECIVADKEFYEDYFLRENNINDSKCYYFEHQLYDSIDRSPYQLFRYCIPLEIEGMSGTSGAVIERQNLSSLQKLQYLRNELLQLKGCYEYRWIQRFWFAFCAVAIRIIKVFYRFISQLQLSS